MLGFVILLYAAVVIGAAAVAGVWDRRGHKLPGPLWLCEEALVCYFPK